MLKSFISFLVLMVSVQAHALRLEYVGETSIPTGTKFEKATIGGLSGMVWSDNTLYALSDDKGRAGEPRFFEFDLKIDKKTVTLTPKKVHFITSLPMEGDKPAGLDPEGLVRLLDGDFLISSEGNNDAKPREMPRIFRVNADGKWKSDFPIPDKFLPETTGQQKKGIQNNAAFEGLTSFADGKFVFTSTESSLAQDYISGEEINGDWIRILKYEDKGQQGYKPVAEYAYRVDAFKDNQKGKEVFRGVSEILALSEAKMLVLERGVRIFSKNLWAQTVAIYLADLSKGTDITGLTKLSDGKFTGVDKIKLIDFETDLTKERGDKTIQNFEALTWGPKLADGRRTLLVMVDNNFSKKELTEMIVFAVEGE
ncbi:esterase-like activity of phytase family protein [Bdellovibrio sp. BCCA]|uniref:esterase-like activity of phytase family protein n=1 Tax=Bdellovibrio sp. BCCA TaxID=3136281 RepID=UPI0030EFE587